MKVFIKGSSGENYTFTLDSSETLADLKSKLKKICGEGVTDTKITFKAKVLPVENDDKTLGSLGIKDNSKIYFTSRMHGGKIYEYWNLNNWISYHSNQRFYFYNLSLTYSRNYIFKNFK